MDNILHCNILNMKLSTLVKRMRIFQFTKNVFRVGQKSYVGTNISVFIYWARSDVRFSSRNTWGIEKRTTLELIGAQG